ncbi:Crp/Fnr family transcriptional regulator [Eubacteriales bacterium OttesenSCG-928-K08]|nr:Crp/Fnr family transcriptional regulator [Eubacteriales bacterium OttesenSCG-928-K08]
MEKTILLNCPLFADIEKSDLDSLLICLQARFYDYKRDDFIFRVGEHAVNVGVVLSGSANVVQEDFWGGRTILAHVEPGGLFGESFSCAQAQQLPVSVVAAQDSTIMLLDYRKIVKECSSACVFHSQLIFNMLRVLAQKNILLTKKMEHISRRTVREKLLSFLSEQAVSDKSNKITLPFNRQELADYLCVERSALSRELSAMQKDGLLEYRKNLFTLNSRHEITELPQ